MFSDVLICADYDRTLTDPFGSVPESNLKAIQEFMAKGGAFTVNTGRSVPMASAIFAKVPINAPALLYNGAAAYDTVTRQLTMCHPLELNPEEVVTSIHERFPQVLLEVQGVDAHYGFWEENHFWEEMCKVNGAKTKMIRPHEIPRPFLKFSMTGTLESSAVSQLFLPIYHEEAALLDEITLWMGEKWGEKITIARAGYRILDVQAAGTSKGALGRSLAKAMGRKVLVCVGDEENDRSMLEEGDLSFVPTDGRASLQGLFGSCAPCAEGSVASVIAQLPRLLEKGGA